MSPDPNDCVSGARKIGRMLMKKKKRNSLMWTNNLKIVRNFFLDSPSYMFATDRRAKMLSRTRLRHSRPLHAAARVYHVLKALFRLCCRYSCKSPRPCKCKPVTSAGPAASAAARWAAAAWRWANRTSVNSASNRSAPTTSWSNIFASIPARSRTSVPTASAGSNSSATYNNTLDCIQVSTKTKLSHTS